MRNRQTYRTTLQNYTSVKNANTIKLYFIPTLVLKIPVLCNLDHVVLEIHLVLITFNRKNSQNSQNTKLVCHKSFSCVINQEVLLESLKTYSMTVKFLN